MSTLWKIIVILSLSLNLVCFGAIARLGEKLVEAQSENLSLFGKLSSDQQSLRREVGERSVDRQTPIGGSRP